MSGNVAQRHALREKMVAHGLLGGLGIPAPQRGEHRQVLRQALLQAAGRMQLLQPRQAQDLAQVADHLGQPAVVGQHDEGFVDRMVGRVVLGDAAGGSMFLEPLVQHLQRGHVGHAGAQRRLVRGAALQQRDHGEDLVQVPLRHLGHETAPPGLVAQQALGREHLQRLAQGCARDGEPLAQRGFVQKGARRELTRKDLLAQAFCDVVVQRGGRCAHTTSAREGLSRNRRAARHLLSFGDFAVIFHNYEQMQESPNVGFSPWSDSLPIRHSDARRATAAAHGERRQPWDTYRAGAGSRSDTLQRPFPPGFRAALESSVRRRYARRLPPCPRPQQPPGDDHRHAEPLAHAHAERQDAEERVRLAEIFGDEAEAPVSHEERRRHLTLPALAPRIQPQQHEQQQPFHQELVHLRRMARQHRAALREHHAPGQRRVAEPSPEFAVDEIAHAPGRKARRHAGCHEIRHLQPRPVARAGEPHHRCDHPQQPAVEAHAALPDVEDLQRMRQVVAGLVEQAIAQAPAHHHAHHAQKQDVLHVLAGPGLRAGERGIRLVPQPARAQEHEEAERGQVGQAIPVDGERPDLQGDGIDMRVHEHGGRYCARRVGPAAEAPSRGRRRRIAPSRQVAMVACLKVCAGMHSARRRPLRRAVSTPQLLQPLADRRGLVAAAIDGFATTRKDRFGCMRSRLVVQRLAPASQASLQRPSAGVPDFGHPAGIGAPAGVIDERFPSMGPVQWIRRGCGNGHGRPSHGKQQRRGGHGYSPGGLGGHVRASGVRAGPHARTSTCETALRAGMVPGKNRTRPCRHRRDSTGFRCAAKRM